MIHEKRRFKVEPAESARELAEQLATRTFCGCQGFEYRGVLFLNDSFSADGAQEYAVLVPVARDSYEQVESITFSWCSVPTAERYILEAARGDYKRIAGPLALSLQTPDEHGVCSLCA